jgi:flavin reductase (DIM6/NTAB) family NADH-FMN oxidoreductase RutF
VELKPIPLDSLTLSIHRIFDKDWFLLTCGDFPSRHFNTMTISWGALGFIWGKPVAMVVVRPQRYTHEFTERYGDFTLSSFPKRFRTALNLLGSTSGRQGDKIGKSGLTPCAAESVRSPCFEEATLVLECRKIYRDPIDPAGFLDPAIAANYPARDYHTMYFGEIVAARGKAEHAGR